MIKSFRLESVVYAEFLAIAAEEGKTATELIEEFLRFYVAGGRLELQPLEINQEDLIQSLVKAEVSKNYSALANQINTLTVDLQALEESIQDVKTLCKTVDLQALVASIQDVKTDNIYDLAILEEVNTECKDTCKDTLEEVNTECKDISKDISKDTLEEVNTECKDISKDTLNQGVEARAKQLSFFPPTDTPSKPSKPKNCTPKGLAIVQAIIRSKLDESTSEADIIEYLEHQSLGKAKYLKRDLSKNIRACSVQLVGCQCNDFAELKQALLK